MTLKWYFVFLLVVTSTIGQYDGDPCTVEYELGTCKVLNECKPLLEEVKRAGFPMPFYLRAKLESVRCGFYYDDPLYCCMSSNDHDHTPEPNIGTNNNLTNRKNENNNNNIGGFQKHKNFDLLPVNCGSSETNKVYGGKATSLLETPWMVLIAYNSPRGRKLSCGGTLINENYVLTAAHCIAFLGSLKPASVLLGEHDVRTNPDCEPTEDNGVMCAPDVTEVGISSTVAHPGYTPQTLRDDIGLIRLAAPADFSSESVRPICLPHTSELQAEDLVGEQGVVTGWGATESGLQSDALLSVDLPILANSKCESAYKIKLTDKQMCAGGIENKDACAGDSGGPLITFSNMKNKGGRLMQRGIVSFGSKQCGIKNLPGIFTRVGAYMDWILDNIRE